MINEEYMLEANYSHLAKTAIVSSKIYTQVAKAFPSNKNAVKKCIGDYITSRYNFLYATAPFDRLPFGADDYNKFWKAIKLNPVAMENIMKQCWFYNVPYNPRSAKNPFTAVVLMCIRYCLETKDMKMAELLGIYLSFSGQFYPSIHSNEWPYLPNKEVMEYVVNNKLSDKYSLKKYGNVFGCIRSVAINWIEFYEKDIKDKTLDDDSYGTIVQQLHDRVKSFLKNIASLYYNNKDNYLNYVRNNMDSENYILTDNNSSLADKFTEQCVDYMTTREINYKFCSKVADENVKKDEVKSIMSSIFHNKDNIADLRLLVNILIADFMRNYPDEPLSGVKFLTYSMSTKPNSKDKNIIKVRDIINKWLQENSIDYVRRKSRQSTAISYYKCILKMICLYINAATK